MNVIEEMKLKLKSKETLSESEINHLLTIIELQKMEYEILRKDAELLKESHTSLRKLCIESNIIV